MADNATDPNQGSARDAGATSLSGLLATLAPTLVVAGIFFGIFLILRKSQRRYYAPRTYLGSLKENERSPDLPNGMFNWIGPFWKIPDTYALKHQSLDAYLFLRFLRIAHAICVGGVVLTWPILLPLNITGGNNKSQLERLSFGNINTKDINQRNKLYGHAVVGWIFYGFVLYMVMRELIFYINLRQASLLSPVYSCRMSARTVLFTSVPKPYLDEGRLRKLFGDSVKRIWITGDTKGLDEIVEERDKVAMKLEKAEVKLIKLANKERQKALSHGANGDNPDSPVDPESGDIAARWIPNNKRPTHRTGPLGLIGKKVDTIEWCREELKRLIPDAEREQQRYRKGDYKKIAAVFVEFNNQSAAQAAYQILTHHHALHMAPRYIGIQPGEIVWSSLRIPWWQKVVRRYLVIGFITVMILFWAIPVVFVGFISNVGFLKTISWLSWLNKIPDVIMGVVSGLLPSIMMSILMSLVPVVMRLCAKLAGEPSLSRVELFTQNAYFAFQVIQVFLITTVSSSAVAVAEKIVDDPTNTPAILAENLPTASNFYISYFLLQGLTIGVSVLAQVVGFVIFNLVYKFFTSTPRDLYNKWANLSAISWGSTMPVYTLISVISITYAGIAPLVSAFGALGIALFYLAYRYNILFVTDTRIDTQGLLYPRAIKQLMTGVYLAEICMIGLFSSSKAPGPAIMMLVFLIFTVLFQITLFSSLNPLLYNLPQSLQVAEESLDTAAADLEAVAPGSGTKGPAHSTSALENARESSSADADGAQPEGKKPNFLIKWLKPWKYANYTILRKVVPRDGPTDINTMYPPDVANDAYYPPNVSLAAPLLWIPEDPAGVSKQEVARTGKVIPITDEGCTLNENGKLEWDAETARPPVWEEKILY